MDNKATVQFYPKVNKVKIDANSTAFYPQYLKYLFEYLKIPQNATIIFKAPATGNWSVYAMLSDPYGLETVKSNMINV